MLEAFIKYILGEFRGIAYAPVSFLASAVALSVLVWWVMDWRYQGVIEDQRSTIQTLTQENGRHRVAIGSDPATPVALTSLSNKELSLKAATVVSRLRDMYLAYENSPGKSQQEKGIDDEAKAKARTALLNNLSYQFVTELRSDAFNVDFELRRRLGPKAVAGIVEIPNETRMAILQLPSSGPIPGFVLAFTGTLADGIEQMAKLLPADG